MCSNCKIVTLFIILTEVLFTSAGSSKRLDIESRIVGGHEVRGDYLAKYIVSLRNMYPRITGIDHFCGGSILNTRVILTAAHCFYKQDGTQKQTWEVVVVAGVRYRLKRERTAQIKLIEKIIIHPHFKHGKHDYDIALLILDSNLNEDHKHVQRIPMNDKPVEPGWRCTAFGWGMLSEEGPLPDKILYVNLNISTEEICKEWNTVYPVGHFCAAGSAKGSGVCNGDSGGPIVCEGAILTGVSSYVTYPCGSRSYFTDVYYYRNWIKKSALQSLRNDAKSQAINAFISFIILVHKIC